MNLAGNFNEEDIVVFSPAYYDSSTFFIFRSANAQVELRVRGRNLFSSHILTAFEIESLKKNLPFINVESYSIFLQKYNGQ